MSLFGSSTPSFGSSTATSQQPLFGNTSVATGGGLFGPSTQAAFGSSTTSSAGSMFAPRATTSAGLFSTPTTGLFSTPISAATTGGLFGATTSAPSFNLGAPPPATAPTGFSFARPQQTQPTFMQQGNLPADVAVVRAVTNPQLFGDERDGLVAGLNQLLALTGHGAKAYYQAGQNPAEMKLENPYCRFKAVGYSKIPDNADACGLVAIIIGRKAEEVRTQEQSVKDIIYKILGNKPALSVHIEAIKPLINDRCEIVLYVLERIENSAARKIGSSELAAFLTQQTSATQLQQQLAAQGVAAKTTVDPNRLQQYLQTPPSGIDPVIWAQAKANNPNRETLIPTPIFGFDQLAERQKMQTQEGHLQIKCLNELRSRIDDLGCSSTALQSRARQLRSTQQQMSHRLLKLVAIENMRLRQGYAVDGSEEALHTRLESLNLNLNAPMQLKGRVGELVSLVRSRPELLIQQKQNKEEVEEEFLDEAKVFLARCQHTIEGLADIITKDSQTLETIKKCEGGVLNRAADLSAKSIY